MIVLNRHTLPSEISNYSLPSARPCTHLGLPRGRPITTERPYACRDPNLSLLLVLAERQIYHYGTPLRLLLPKFVTNGLAERQTYHYKAPLYSPRPKFVTTAPVEKREAELSLQDAPALAETHSCHYRTCLEAGRSVTTGSLCACRDVKLSLLDLIDLSRGKFVTTRHAERQIYRYGAPLRLSRHAVVTAGLTESQM